MNFKFLLFLSMSCGGGSGGSTSMLVHQLQEELLDKLQINFKFE